MKNLSKKPLRIENTVMELQEIISHISEIITRAGEMVLLINEITSEPEEIQPAIVSTPESTVAVPGQATKREREN